MSALSRQLRWYIVIRLVVITSVVLPFSLLQLSPAPAIEPPARPASIEAPGSENAPAAAVTPAPSEDRRTNLLYLLAAFTYAASGVYIVLFRLLRRQLATQAYIQFFGDLALITGLVYYFGGIASSFSLLYLLVISVASTMLYRRAGVIVATGAYALYSGMLLASHLHFLQNPDATMDEATLSWRLPYSLAVHLFGFYAVAFLTSILARRVARVEQELEEKSENLADLQVVHRDVIQSITSGLITLDLDGAITSVNRAGCVILGHPEHDLVGAPIQSVDFLSEDTWRELVASTDGRGRLRSEAEVTRQEATVYIGFTVSRLTDADGNHRGYIVTFQDLTRWRRLQEEVRLKDRMAAVGELAAGIAHEIGNPLAAISGSVQMLSRSVSTDSSERKLLDILHKESQRLDRTIKGFLRFARPKDRSSVPFDVAGLLAENFELLRNSDEVSTHHHLELDLDPPAVTLIADPDQISQIFWNLARNALRAMPGGGLLRVAGRLVAGSYRIQVSDTGRGMSEDERANLFHPFHSFFDTGTGIGMAIVYRIVQEHRGRLWVDSLPGAGTTISVDLPTPEAVAVSELPVLEIVE